MDQNHQNSIGGEEFESYLFSQLEIIDDILSKQEVDLPDRPFTAADMFINTSLVSVNGNPPDHYIVEPWFKYVIRPIKKWYDRKYGSAATLRPNKAAKGVLLHKGSFYQLDIPLTLLVPKGDLREFIIPKEILSFEKELDFVKHPQHIPTHSDDESTFTTAVRNVVNYTRSINNNLTTAQFKHQLCRELSNGIEAHIQKAVDDILSGQPNRFLISYWELHLAIEKSMKVIIVQSGRPNLYVHDLIELKQLVDEVKPSLIQPGIVERFPTGKEIISYRYGNGPTVTRLDIYENYLRVLALVEILTKEFDRKLTFNNTVFVLGKLPWQ